MKRPLQLPLQDYDGMKQMLDAEERVEIDRNAWKRDEWKDGEDVGKHLPCVESSCCLDCRLNPCLLPLCQLSHPSCFKQSPQFALGVHFTFEITLPGYAERK